MALATLKEIKEQTHWVARFPGCRFVGTYEQVEKYGKDPDCKDFDTVCWEGQPANLQKFWRDFEAYSESHPGFLTIDQFYPIWEKMNTGPRDEPIPRETQNYLNKFVDRKD